MSKFETLPAGSPVGTNATIVDWEPKDKWRSVVMGLIADIFTQSCNPMVKSEYAHGINAIIKGYLLDFVKGENILSLRFFSKKTPDLQEVWQMCMSMF